jgi:protein xylosyltransferase
MHREMSVIAAQFPLNVRMVRERHSGIWGGISVLEMILSGLSELLSLHSTDWKWDFVVNLSESDYPIKSREALRAYLGANRERNFVKSHGRDPSGFVKKQALNQTFVECEGRMWRLGPRKLQEGIQLG